MNEIASSDLSLLTKYNDRCPRYTSYPTALEFNEQFTNDDFKVAAHETHHQQLSIYIHVPFCHSLCYYCGCNKIVTRHQFKADEYIHKLLEEINLRSQLFKHQTVIQLHLGGGTPSFLTRAQLTRLIHHIKRMFYFDTKVEMSIEIDPRKIDLEYLDMLHALGFNRISIGVQDTDTHVQKAINRVQDTDFVGQMVRHAHELGFTSVNLDLIYGLPHQSLQTFANTLADILKMSPERISLFSYAHLPSRFAAQRKIKDEWLPSSDDKLELMRYAIKTLLDHDYVMIGMDHFAKPSDELAKAKKKGQLLRNFQGYTIYQDCDLLGLGVSAISQVGNIYSQNKKDLIPYYESIEKEGQAIEKGYLLTNDDLVRGYVIQQLMCNLFLDKEKFRFQFHLDFDKYFASEMEQLVPFIEDDLVIITDHHVLVSEKARLIIRHICKIFDAYQLNAKNQMRYSRVI